MNKSAQVLIELVFLINISCIANAENITLFSPGISPPLVVISSNATEAEKYAAEELSFHLYKITGTKIETVNDQKKLPENSIVIALGQNSLTSSYDVSKLDPEQYITEIKKNQVVIIGGRSVNTPGQHERDAGTLYGVYEFLENLGVRWYRPEEWGRHIPSHKEIKLELGKTISKKPSNFFRATLSGGMSYSREESTKDTRLARNWAVRNRTNAGFTSPAKSSIYGGIVEHSKGKHNWPSLVPASEYFDQHPEYFALINGKRDPFDLCPGNPEVQQIIAEKIIDRAKKNPNRGSISVEPADGRGGNCQCELCLKMDQPLNKRISGKVSNRVAALGNIIAKKVKKEVPWLKIQWLSYSGHTAAPTNIKQLEPNAMIALCPINGWDDWTKKLEDPSSRSNALFKRTAKDWAALKPDIMITFLYYNGYGWPGPLPITRVISNRMKQYRKMGVTGHYLPSVISWGPAGLDYYMYTRLVWNPDLNVNQELNLYYKNYYGPAEKPMKNYHERLMQALEESPHRVFSGGRGMHLVMTPKLIKELGKYMNNAQSLVKGRPLYERRLFGVRAGYDFSRRVSEILSIKKKTGVMATKVPQEEKLTGTADLERPVFTGSGSYYQSTEAEAAYQELIKWMQSVNQNDPVFDMSMNPKDDASEIIYAKRGHNFGSTFLNYMARDILISINVHAKEADLLTEF